MTVWMLFDHTEGENGTTPTLHSFWIKCCQILIWWDVIFVQLSPGEKNKNKKQNCATKFCVHIGTHNCFFLVQQELNYFHLPGLGNICNLQNELKIFFFFFLIIYSSRWFLVFEGSENTFRTVVSVDFVVWWFGLQTTWCWAATLWLMVIHERHKLATDLHLQCVFQKAL